MLQKGEYFEAHEVLEEAWHPLRKANHPLKNLVKGLINAAVAFEHLKRCEENGPRRARIVMASFDRYSYFAVDGIENASLFKEACQLVKDLKSKSSDVFDG